MMVFMRGMKSSLITFADRVLARLRRVMRSEEARRQEAHVMAVQQLLWRLREAVGNDQEYLSFYTIEREIDSAFQKCGHPAITAQLRDEIVNDLVIQAALEGKKLIKIYRAGSDDDPLAKLYIRIYTL